MPTWNWRPNSSGDAVSLAVRGFSNNRNLCPLALSQQKTKTPEINPAKITTLIARQLMRCAMARHVTLIFGDIKCRTAL